MYAAEGWRISLDLVQTRGPGEAAKEDTIIISERRRPGEQKDRGSKVQTNGMMLRVEDAALSPMMISEVLYIVLWYTADRTS